MTTNLRFFFVFAFAFALVLPCSVAAAQDDTAADIDGIILPDWAGTLAFGTLGLSLLVSAATEITKRVLKLAGLYKDGWARWIVLAWAGGFVVLAFVSDLLNIGAVVDDRVALLYHVMLLLLTIMGAPTAYVWAKATGLVESGEK